MHAPRYDEARRALARFAEPEKSPEHMHTYRLTPLALWNAARGVAQIYGLASVGREIGAHILEGVGTGEYCFFASNQKGETLPALLARYLIAHHRVRGQ